MRGAAADGPGRRAGGRLLFGAVVLAVAVAAAVLPGASGTAAASPAWPPVPALYWAACGNGFECATAAVPLDYDHPGGPAISLALIRLPALDQRHRIGSLLTNPAVLACPGWPASAAPRPAPTRRG